LNGSESHAWLKLSQWKPSGKKSGGYCRISLFPFNDSDSIQKNGRMNAHAPPISRMYASTRCARRAVRPDTIPLCTAIYASPRPDSKWTNLRPTRNCTSVMTRMTTSITQAIADA
jgi:hypothetical protein